MTPTQPIVTRDDISEIKASMNRMESKIENLSDISIRNEHVLTFVGILDETVNGKGQNPNGHVQRIANHETRITALEGKNLLFNNIAAKMFGPVLGMLGVGIVALIIIALATQVKGFMP